MAAFSFEEDVLKETFDITQVTKDIEVPYWAKLVPAAGLTTTALGKPFDYTTVEIQEDKLVVGRNPALTQIPDVDCLLLHKDGCISKTHCEIWREDRDKIWLVDRSRNGILINESPIPNHPLHGKRRLLQHNDEIVLVHPKFDGRIRSKVSYTFVMTDPPEKKEHLEFRKRYVKKEKLGSGAFGQVYVALHVQSGVRYAVKEIENNRYQSTMSFDVIDEINIMKQMNHENIVKVFDVVEEMDKGKKSYTFIVMEHCGHGDLNDYLVATYRDKRSSLNETVASNIFKQTLMAVQYVHEQGIMHRDLKPENLLLSSINPPIVKLTDFGLSKLLENAKQGCQTVCGSPAYAAPEVENSVYSFPADFWALGCILHALLCGRQPFFEGGNRPTLQEQKRHAKEWLNLNHPHLCNRSKTVLHLMTRLIVTDPNGRFNFKKTRGHPWLNPRKSSKKPKQKRNSQQQKRKRTSLSTSLSQEDTPPSVKRTRPSIVSKPAVEEEDEDLFDLEDL